MRHRVVREERGVLLQPCAPRVQNGLAGDGIAIRIRLELRRERYAPFGAPVREASRVLVAALLRAVSRCEARIRASGRGDDALERDE
ncbi:MAG: hypothetical protein ABIQ10_04630 [Gemmatimonadaceae bacterium]